jgi:hypothetical protein
MRRCAGLLLVVSACSGGSPPAAEVPELDVEPPGAAAAGPELATPEPAAADRPEVPGAAPGDVFVHDASGAWFPMSAGPFQRGDVTVYDPDGLDVGVAYRARADLDGTVFVYPSDRDPPDPIQAVKYAIEYHNPDARLLAERDVAIALGDLALRGDYVAYQLADQVSVGYVFQHDTWNLKYRFRFPTSSDRAAAERDIEALLESLRWP